MISFEERFKQLVLERGLCFEDFSKVFELEFGYCLDYSSLIGEGVVFPPISVVIDLCKFFEVSCNYLLGVSSVRGGCNASSTYDQYMALFAVILGSDKYSDGFKEELFLDIRNRLCGI